MKTVWSDGVGDRIEINSDGDIQICYGGRVYRKPYESWIRSAMRESAIEVEHHPIMQEPIWKIDARVTR